MASKKEETAVAVKDEKIVTIGDETMNIDQLVEQVGQMKVGATISSDYWTPEVGESVKVVFAGMSSMKALNAQSENDTVPAVKLLMTEGESKGLFVKNADKVLVGICKDLTAPKPILIECTGKDGKPGRQYKTFVVKELN